MYTTVYTDTISYIETVSRYYLFKIRKGDSVDLLFRGLNLRHNSDS